MLERLNVGRPARVIGADGRPLTLDDLPPSEGVRWNKKRKAQVVAAVRGGLISFDEAVRRYSLSSREFVDWQQELLDSLAARRRAVERRDFRLLRRQVTAVSANRLKAG